MPWDWTLADIAEVTLVGRLYNQLTMSVLHFRPTVLSITADKAVADDLDFKITAAGELWELYRACLSTDWKGTQIGIQRIKETRMRRFEYDHAGDDGTVASIAGTGNVDAVIETWTENATVRTTGAGEGQTGAIRVPALPRSMYSDGMVTNAFRTNQLKNFAVKMVAPITTPAGNEWQLVIYHPKGLTKLSDDVVGYTVKDTVRVVRRRTVGVGK